MTRLVSLAGCPASCLPDGAALEPPDAAAGEPRDGGVATVLLVAWEQSRPAAPAATIDSVDSPLAGHTERQRAALEALLGRRGAEVAVRATVATSAPLLSGSVRDAAGAAFTAGVDQLIVLPLRPQVSLAALCAICRGLAAARGTAGASGRSLTLDLVEDWHDEPRLLSALASATYEGLDAVWSAGSQDRPNVDWALAQKTDTPVVFVAPMPDETGPPATSTPPDPYPERVAETARAIAERFPLPSWSLAYLATMGDAGPPLPPPPLPPPPPQLIEVLRALADRGERTAVVSPVGTIADDEGLLRAVDVEAQAVARELGLWLERARSLNDDPAVVAAMADAVWACLDASKRAG